VALAAPPTTGGRRTDGAVTEAAPPTTGGRRADEAVTEAKPPTTAGMHEALVESVSRRSMAGGAVRERAGGAAAPNATLTRGTSAALEATAPPVGSEKVRVEHRHALVPVDCGGGVGEASQIAGLLGAAGERGEEGSRCGLAGGVGRGALAVRGAAQEGAEEVVVGRKRSRSGVAAGVGRGVQAAKGVVPRRLVAAPVMAAKGHTGYLLFARKLVPAEC
jgi:hypothetical protein